MTGENVAAIGSAQPPQQTDVHALACAALSAGDNDAGKAIIDGAAAQRLYALPEKLRTFYRDGFLDRYSGDPLIHPGALRTLSMLLPKDLPAEPNGR